MLTWHLQDLSCLFCESSCAIFLEVLEHHAIVDELSNEEQVLGLPEGWKSTGRYGSIADEL